MASIKFKRGTYTKLQELKANTSWIEDGCFYLTTDNATNSTKLYVGKEFEDHHKEVVPVNQGITQFTNKTALSTYTQSGKVNYGDFAYVDDGNIFAIYNGEKWVQINSSSEDDQYIKSVSYTVNVENGIATVSLSGVMNKGISVLTGDSFSIQGANGITVSANDKALTINGDPYTISAAKNDEDGGVDVTLASSHGTPSVVNIVGKENTTVDYKNGSIEISSPAVESVEITPVSTGGFEVAVSDGKNRASGKINPTITYGGVAGENPAPATFDANGNATLDVYSKAQVDKLFKNYDAIVYRGTVDKNTNWESFTHVKNGDCYKAASAVTFEQPDTGDEETLKTGDLIIAQGTEDETGWIAGTFHWTIIPSGDEIVDYLLKGLTNAVGVELNYDGRETRGTLQFQSGTDINGIKATDVDPINITQGSSGINNTIVRVGHAAPTPVAGTNTTIVQDPNQKATASSSTQTIQVVTGILTDKWGHYQGVNTTTFKPTDTNSTVETFATTVATPQGADVGTGVTITPALSLKLGDGSSSPGSAPFNIISSNSNLTLTPSETNNNSFIVDMVWEEF